MFEERIRHLLVAHRTGHITSEEAEDELALLAHRAQTMHPIPLDEAVKRMAELASKNPGSQLRGGAYGSKGDRQMGVVRDGRGGHRLCVREP